MLQLFCFAKLKAGLIPCHLNTTRIKCSQRVEFNQEAIGAYRPFYFLREYKHSLLPIVVISIFLDQPRMKAIG